MFDLNKLKLVLMDFDGTLCIHNCREYESSEECQREFHAAVMNGLYPWDMMYNLEPMYSTNLHMKSFMTLCKNKSLMLGMLSASTLHKSGNLKIDWVNSVYDVKLNNFNVGRIEDKIPTLNNIAKIYGLKANEILVIDSSEDLLYSAASYGFQTASPLEISVYMMSKVQGW